MIEHLPEILIGLGSGVLVQLANWITARVNAKRDDFGAVLTVWKEDNERLRIEQRENHNKIDDLERNVMLLRAKVSMLESSHIDLPFPMWIKDTKGVMLSVNKPYEEAFLIPSGLTASDYVGKDDKQIWGEETGAIFRANDLKVLKSKSKKWVGEETWAVSGVESGHSWTVAKYIQYAGNVAIGIAGICLPKQ